MCFNFVEESRGLSCLNVRVGFYPAGIHRLVDNRLITPEKIICCYKNLKILFMCFCDKYLGTIRCFW
jgi:hypothetical protein